MGFGFSDLFGGGAQLIGDTLGGALGGDVAEEAAELQVASGERALDFGAEQVAPFRDIGVNAAEQLPAAQFGGFDRDPGRVLNNPLFQALSQQQNQQLINQQGALGRGGSGETNDLLTQNVLRLGSQFQQQDFQNQLAENQQQFGQLFDQTRLGANAASQQATSGQNIIQGIGNAQAAGSVAQSNALNNLIGQGAGLGALAFSDVRLKENIQYSHTANGINIYTWSWTNDSLDLVGDQIAIGPLAQEVKETHSEAVTIDESGFYKVDNEALAWH